MLRQFLFAIPFATVAVTARPIVKFHFRTEFEIIEMAQQNSSSSQACNEYGSLHDPTPSTSSGYGSTPSGSDPSSTPSGEERPRILAADNDQYDRPKRSGKSV